MTIRYEAYTSDGQKVSGALPVDTEASAEELLWRSNLIVTSLKPERAPGTGVLHQIYRQLPTLFHPSVQELVGFTRELATLLNAGIALREALIALQDRITSPLFKDAVLQIIQEIETGGSLSQAIAKHPSIFPLIYSRLVTVGEETGALARAISQVADYLERQGVLAARVTNALRYPAFVMVAGIGAAFVLLTFALPALASMLKEFGGELPITAKILMGIADIAARFGLWALLGIAVVAVGLGLYFSTPPGARRRSSLMLQTPLVGKVIRLAAMFRFTSGLSIMLSSGLPLVESLELTARVIGDIIISEIVLQVRGDVMGGLSLSQALARQPLFPSIVRHLVVVGEKSGTLQDNLNTASKFIDQETDRTISSLTAMIEPTMIVVMGGGMGFIAVAFFSALYGTLGQIK